MTSHKSRLAYAFACAMILFAGAAQPAPAEAPAETAAEEKSPTLFECLGGLAPISVVVSDFIDALVPDPVLNQNPAIDAARKRVPAPYLKYQVTALVCQTTGGPCQYTGRAMKESHAHLNITAGEWDRMVVIFKDVLAKHQVPAAEQQELLDIVGSTRADIVMASTAPAASTGN